MKIITPDELFYDGETQMVEFKTTEGEIGVYKNHIPLTVVVTPGKVVVHLEGKNQQALVTSGFAQILQESVTVMVESASWQI